MNYESGIRIIHHPTTKTVTVSFRNKVAHLGPFGSRAEAVAVAEAYCRERGWLSEDDPQ